MRTEALSGWRREGCPLGHQTIERALGGRGRGGDCSPGLQQVKPQPPFMAFWWVNHKQTYRQETCPIPPATPQAPPLRPIRAYQVPEQQNPRLGIKLLFPRTFPAISAFRIPPAQFHPPPPATPLLSSPFYHNFNLSPLQLLCRNYKARLHGNPHNGISIRCCIEFLLKTSICLDSFHKRLELLF